MAEVFLEMGEPEIPEAVRPLLGGFFRFEPKVHVALLAAFGVPRQADDVRSPGQADIPPQGQRTSEAFTSNYLNRRFSRDNWSIDEQPISFIPRSISVRIRPSARSTPAWPAAAS
jgi:hypothetical protein